MRQNYSYIIGLRDIAPGVVRCAAGVVLVIVAVCWGQAGPLRLSLSAWAIATYRLYLQRSNAQDRDAVLMRIGNLYRTQLGQFDAAQSFSGAFVDIQLRFGALESFARAHQKVGLWIEAAGCYRRMQELPQALVPPSSINLKTGFCLHQAKRYDEAGVYFDKARAGASAIESSEIAYWNASSLAAAGFSGKPAETQNA